LAKQDNEIWFYKKKYGYGWGRPASWQGWVAILAYMALLIGGGVLAGNHPLFLIPYAVLVVILSGGLIFICWKKGENLDLPWNKGS
jgi:hypothetical protein